MYWVLILSTTSIPDLLLVVFSLSQQVLQPYLACFDPDLLQNCFSHQRHQFALGVEIERQAMRLHTIHLRMEISNELK